MLTLFAERFDTTIVPIARERWVSVRLPTGVELYGKVDRVDPAGSLRDGTVDIIDYKTGRAVIDGEDLHDEPAAEAYLIASEDEYQRELRRVRYIYLAHGIESRWEPEREDVETARQALLDITQEMYSDQLLEPRPGEHCSRCPLAHVCPDAGRSNSPTWRWWTMISRPERRRACHASVRTRRATTPSLQPPMGVPIVRAGALDAPLDVFVATAWFAAAGCAMSDLQSVMQAIHTLKPFSAERHAEWIVYRFLCTAVDLHAAGWRVIDRVREVTDLPLLRVQIGFAAVAEPAVVFTSRHGRPA